MCGQSLSELAESTLILFDWDLNRVGGGLRVRLELVEEGVARRIGEAFTRAILVCDFIAMSGHRLHCVFTWLGYIFLH